MIQPRNKPLQRSFRGPQNPSKEGSSIGEQPHSTEGQQVIRTRISREPRRVRLDDNELQVYLFEMHDFGDEKLYGDRFWANIRDINASTSVEIPLSMAKSLASHLLMCKNDSTNIDDIEEDEQEEGTDPEKDKPSVKKLSKFNLQLLQNKRFLSADKSFALETIDVKQESEESVPVKCLICEPVSEGTVPKADGDTEIKATPSENAPESDERRDLLKPKSKKGTITLTTWLLPRLLLFLRDVSIRHMTLERPIVRSLYAPSAERRFYFDAHQTRWGNRLLISQVTLQHRNVISLPLESVVQFRNRLDVLIEKLSLDDGCDVRLARSTIRKPYPSLQPRVMGSRVVPGRRSNATRRAGPGGMAMRRRFRRKPVPKKEESTGLDETAGGQEKSN